MIWGLDLGVRSFHAAGLDQSTLTLAKKVLASPRGKIDNTSSERATELRVLGSSFRELLAGDDHVYIEEPPMVRNYRTFLKLGQVAGALACWAPVGVSVHFVPVDTWKMSVIGKGGVNKDTVKDVLTASHPSYAAQCHGDQNFIDAICIALHGRQALTRGAHELGTGLQPVGSPRGSRGPRSKPVGSRVPRTTVHIPRP